MRYNELERDLKKNGCYLVRNGSNHDLWFSPITNYQFAMPRHAGKEVANGTLRAIQKQAGLMKVKTANFGQGLIDDRTREI